MPSPPGRDIEPAIGYHDVMAQSLYKPRPDRWSQFSVRTLFSLTTVSAILAATVLPGAIAAYRRAHEFDELIHLIETTVAPDEMWGDAPGGGSIKSFDYTITCGFGSEDPSDDEPAPPENETDPAGNLTTP